VDWNG